MEFAQRLKQVMADKSITMYRLAKELGVHQTTIKNWLDGKGEPRISEASNLATALEIPIEYLLSGESVVSQVHLANGVHIYKDTFPFKVIEPFLDNPLSNSCDILYQDEYLIIAVEKESTATQEELEKILDAYAPFREQKSREDTEFLASVKEGEFHTRMNTAFHELNFSGKQEAAKRVEELTEIPRYRTETAPQSPPAAQEGKDTTPPPEGAEGPGEGGRGCAKSSPLSR